MLVEKNPVVQLQGISKQFPGVLAVNDVSLDIYPGEVHVVAGENGAGKSTLMKLLSQVERPTKGTILLDGQAVHFSGPAHAQSLGIAMVYQEFALAPHLSIAENIFLGREPMRLGFIDRRSERQRARELLQRIGLRLNPDRIVSTLSVAEQQLVEIAKALAIDARLVIMDEPTATLTGQEIEELFAVIHNLTAKGIAILYISHRLEEIFRIGDRVTVMRDGQVVTTLPRAEIDEKKLILLMVGRDIANLYPKPEATIGEVVLRAEHITRGHVLQDCSFEVHAGEILGFAGLVGAGRTELARAVFGADHLDSGSIWMDGRKRRIKSPESAIDAGIGYLTEDRKKDGLALTLGIDKNITLANIPAFAGVLNLGREKRIALRARDSLRIRTPSIQRQVNLLSGGNQQKVIVARWLETRARALFFDEPSRGIDVGAKAEVFELIGRLAVEGRAIVLISSYLPELLNMCDRILVLREGRIVGSLQREQFSEERIIALATGAREVEAL
ncbi:MAG TPA: sugar ABC transporter ATP-binding protein [Ktedonobacteraceae bacterium]|nr:sugar ABC transporter ATP-binding protein [Ktedonobacteraceae bacterium]